MDAGKASGAPQSSGDITPPESLCAQSIEGYEKGEKTLGQFKEEYNVANKHALSAMMQVMVRVGNKKLDDISGEQQLESSSTGESSGSDSCEDPSTTTSLNNSRKKKVGPRKTSKKGQQTSSDSNESGEEGSSERVTPLKKDPYIVETEANLERGEILEAVTDACLALGEEEGREILAHEKLVAVREQSPSHKTFVSSKRVPLREQQDYAQDAQDASKEVGACKQS